MAMMGEREKERESERELCNAWNKRRNWNQSELEYFFFNLSVQVAYKAKHILDGSEQAKLETPAVSLGTVKHMLLIFTIIYVYFCIQKNGVKVSVSPTKF